MELKSKIRIRFILFRALVILLTVAVAGLAAGLIGYILKKVFLMYPGNYLLQSRIF